MVNESSKNISVDGHKGTWYVIDSIERLDVKYFLLEHEVYGEEADCVIIDENGNLVMEDVTNGFNELDMVIKS